MSRLILPEFPDLWATVRIGQIANIIYGKALRAENRIEQGSVSVYGSNGVVGKHDKALHPGPSIIIGRKGTAGAVHYVPGPFWCIDTAFYLDKVNGEINRVVNFEFLAYILQLIDLSRLSIVSGVPGINRTDIENEIVLLPPLSEQRRIADILHQAKKLRHLRRQADEQMKNLRAALFDEIFGNPVKNPKKWPTKSLSKVGQLYRGRSKHRPRDATHLYGGPYPFIQTGDVANSDGWITEYHQTYSEAGLAQSRLWTKGTLCITIAANIAKTGILTFEACFPDSIVGFIPGSQVKVEFVREYFEAIQGRLEAIAPQAAQKNINLQILREVRIPVPPIELQEKFAIYITQVRSTLAGQKVVHEKLDNFFQSLLAQAFTGKLTTEWRRKHAKEIDTEVYQRDKILGPSIHVVHPMELKGEPSTALLKELSSVQQQIYQAVQEAEGYFTAENLISNGDLPPDIIRQTLTLLEAIGLVSRVSLPTSPTGDTILYITAYRALQEIDNSQDDDLAILSPELNV